MPNPAVSQGTLNRLRASVTIDDFPGLNVTASFLGVEGIGLSFRGGVTTPIPSMTGLVPSPEPYQEADVSVHLLKSQSLAAAWKAQLESNSLIGTLTVWPDVNPANGLTVYPLSNGMITSVAPLRLDGRDAGWMITLTGIYAVNSDLWSS